MEREKIAFRNDCFAFVIVYQTIYALPSMNFELETRMAYKSFVVLTQSQPRIKTKLIIILLRRANDDEIHY